jgi:hypothetical protein
MKILKIVMEDKVRKILRIKWKCVKKFCYLSDMIGAGSEAKETSRVRLRFTLQNTEK